MAIDSSDVVIGYPVARVPPPQYTSLSGERPDTSLSDVQALNNKICFCISGGILILLSMLLAYFIISEKLAGKLSEWTVSSAATPSFNLSSAPPFRLSAAFGLDVSVRNPNRVGLDYEKMEGYIVYDGRSDLASSSLPDFHLPENGSATLRFNASAVDVYLDEETVSGISWSLSTNKVVVLGFRLSVYVANRVKLSDRQTVECRGIAIWFPDGTEAGGSTVNPSKRCTVRWTPT